MGRLGAAGSQEQGRAGSGPLEAGGRKTQRGREDTSSNLRCLGRWATKTKIAPKKPLAPAKTEEPSKLRADRPKKTTAVPKKPRAPAKSEPSPPSKLLGILESQKQLGGTSYPPTLARLAELVGDPLAAVSKALSHKDVKARVLLSGDAKAAKVAPEATLVLLAEDIEAIARADRLLEFQLHAARTLEEPAVDAARLGKSLPLALRRAFKAALEQRLEERRMPRGIGALRGKQPLVFLVADAILPPPDPPARGSEAASARSGKGTEPFAARFDAAFAALDRASGGQNYVTLHALRGALADVPRATFDGELSALRRQRRYSLDPSDGRHHQMTEAERDAGIMEAGSLLVYVARRGDS